LKIRNLLIETLDDGDLVPELFNALLLAAVCALDVSVQAQAGL